MTAEISIVFDFLVEARCAWPPFISHLICATHKHPPWIPSGSVMDTQTGCIQFQFGLWLPLLSMSRPSRHGLAHKSTLVAAQELSIAPFAITRRALSRGMAFRLQNLYICKVVPKCFLSHLGLGWVFHRVEPRDQEPASNRIQVDGCDTRPPGGITASPQIGSGRWHDSWGVRGGDTQAPHANGISTPETAHCITLIWALPECARCIHFRYWALLGVLIDTKMTCFLRAECPIK